MAAHVEHRPLTDEARRARIYEQVARSHGEDILGMTCSMPGLKSTGQKSVLGDDIMTDPVYEARIKAFYDEHARERLDATLLLPGLRQRTLPIPQLLPDPAATLDQRDRSYLGEGAFYNCARVHVTSLVRANRARGGPQCDGLYGEAVDELLDDNDRCEIVAYRYLHCQRRHVAHITAGATCGLSKRFEMRCEKLDIPPRVRTVEIFGGCKECVRQGYVAAMPVQSAERPENSAPWKMRKETRFGSAMRANSVAVTRHGAMTSSTAGLMKLFHGSVVRRSGLERAGKAWRVKS